MKATLLFATLSMVFAMPHVSAKTELETLRARCAEQEQKIRQLEDQVHPKRESRSETPAPVSRSSVSPVASDSSSAGSYMVKPGDSVEKIARRSHCSVSSLTKINGLKSTTVIHPGQRLKLPGNSAVASTTTPAKLDTSVKSPTANTPAAPPSRSEKTHKIKQGETYASISKKYRIPVETLVTANPNVKATALRPGMNIRLSSDAPAPAGKQSSPSVAELAAKPTAPKTSTIIATKEPAAKPIAKTTPMEKNTTTVAANSEQSRNSEPVGLRESTSTPISNSPASTPSSSTATATATPESTNAPATNPPAPSPNPNPEKKIRSVKIEDPMTYGQFAAKHGTDANRLNDLNGLDLTTATVLAKGSELYVPAQP